MFTFAHGVSGSFDEFWMRDADAFFSDVGDDSAPAPTVPCVVAIDGLMEEGAFTTNGCGDSCLEPFADGVVVVQVDSSTVSTSAGFGDGSDLASTGPVLALLAGSGAVSAFP